MNNVLKIALIIIGVGLMGYGMYTIFAPEVAGPASIRLQNDRSQSYAMIAFGLLALIGGLAFKKR